MQLVTIDFFSSFVYPVRVRRVIFQVLIGTLAAGWGTAEAQDLYINNGTTNYNPTIRNAPATIQNVFIGDGVGAAGSAVLNVNSGISFGRAFHAILSPDGLLVQGNGNLVRLTALSGTGGEFWLNAPVAQGVDILGTGPDTTFSGAITGGKEQNNDFSPDSGSRIRKSGTSTLTLDGTNTYVSRTFIDGGALRAANSMALGANGSNGNGTYVWDNGSLEITNSTTLAELLYLNGNGFNGNGALRSVSGTNTISSDVQVGWSNTVGATQVAAADARIGVEAGSTLAITGAVTGANAVEKVGGGLLRLSAAGGNSNSGATTVSGGTLALASAGGNAIAGTALTLNSGGTLLLEGASQINDSASLTLAGGNFDTGSGFNETLGTLTLTSNSSITLGAAIHNLQFGASNLLAWTPAATLTIYGWTGILETSGTAGRIYFGSDSTALTAGQLANITFSGYGGQAMLLPDGELVPMAVPEARSILAALLVLGAVFWRERSRLRSLLASLLAVPAGEPGR